MLPCAQNSVHGLQELASRDAHGLPDFVPFLWHFYGVGARITGTRAAITAVIGAADQRYSIITFAEGLGGKAIHV